MFYTYMHVKADTGQPFYIGKGQGKRAWFFANKGHRPKFDSITTNQESN